MKLKGIRKQAKPILAFSLSHQGFRVYNILAKLLLNCTHIASNLAFPFYETRGSIIWLPQVNVESRDFNPNLHVYTSHDV